MRMIDREWERIEDWENKNEKDREWEKMGEWANKNETMREGEWKG